MLAEGKVIGWFQGRSEFGPRALGNRSIIADPRTRRDEGHAEQAGQAQAGIPAVRADRARRAGERRFSKATKTPRSCCWPSACGRSGATKFRPSFMSTAPHACRRCGEEHNERLYRLLKEFEALTGVPVLLNTSFNVKGEPIVETPRRCRRLLPDHRHRLSGDP